MELIPIRTRRLEPPKDDFLSALHGSGTVLHEGDVLTLASKAVAIHEGRCVHKDAADRQQLIEKESDHIIHTPIPGAWDLTVKNDMVTFAGGIDESNAGEYVILLPENPMQSAHSLREALCEQFGLTDLGIVITDSSALPFRRGVIALAIGYAGIVPVNDRTGVPDLFERKFKYTYVDVADALAVAGGFVMGETNESMPACILRGFPYVTFTDEDHSRDLRIAPEGDIFYPIFKGSVY